MKQKREVIDALMGIAIAKAAMLAQDAHDGTHAIAQQALMVGDLDTGVAMMDLCDAFHTIDKTLKEAAKNLLGRLEGTMDAAEVAELKRMAEQ
jgi:hypothetical protein